MPFKLNQHRRYHIPRQRRRVTNWPGYEASLRQRESLTVWFSEEVIGDGLCSRKDERRATEAAVAVHALNRMLELRRTSYARKALTQAGLEYCAQTPDRCTTAANAACGRTVLKCMRHCSISTRASASVLNTSQSGNSSGSLCPRPGADRLGKGGARALA